MVLEGDYLGYNDSVLGNEASDKEDDSSLAQFLVRKQNHTVYNCERGKFDQFKPISSLQLLRINSGMSYPFADRLVEYLTEQAITPLDTVERNIRRVQEMLLLRGRLWSDTEDNRQHPSRKIDASNTGKDFKGYSEVNHPVVGVNQINIEGQ